MKRHPRRLPWQPLNRWPSDVSELILPPVLVDTGELNQILKTNGYAILSGSDVAQQAGVLRDDLLQLNRFWNDLPADAHLKDGGRYRRRRHSCYTTSNRAVVPVPHRAHWQPVEYNALHGGMQRWFEPVSPELSENAAWISLIRWLGLVCSGLKGEQPWFVEAHQFRIDTTDGIGRPTPEGAHRDGVDLVAVFLLERQAVKGGETRVFDAAGPAGQRFTLTDPWSVLLLDDSRIIHESTPIQPADARVPGGHRDTLVLTFRANDFQGMSAT
jgi:hypothetical protein